MVVDSSAWIEILRDGKLSAKCQRALSKQIIQVPTIVMFEVYRKLKLTISEEVALEAVSSLSQYDILELSREVALLAADLGLQFNLAMADSLVLAHAVHGGSELLTLDNDFASIPNVKLIR